MITRIIAIAGALFVAGQAAAETSCAASKTHYESLQTGMSYAAAVDIIGCEGEEMSRSDMAGFTTVMVMWSGSSFGGNMNAMFQNDRLVSKAQFGLK